MNRKVLFMFALLCAVAQGAWGWDGSGTSADPYLIRTSADWKQLADDVSGGNSYSGKFFEMAADIDAQGISVGTSDKPFSGTFSGGMHTLTYNRGGAEPVDDRCAPFIRLDGATIRDLKVTGKVYSSHKFAGGIASLIDGTAVTTISSCGVSSELWAAQAIVSDATFGGLVGAVSETCTATPVIENCTFTGAIQFHATCSGGLVGYTFKMPVTFDHCLYDPTEVPRVDGCATFVRTAPGVECTFKECYYTKQMGTVQGEAVFREVIVPEGCTYRFVSEPQVPFNGVDYYKSGTVIELSVPDDVDFDHWQTISDGCWISNPWQRSGLQTVRDIRYAPDFTIATTMPEAKEERKMDGTVYRYLYKQDYHLYISDEEVAAKRYYFDDKGEMFKWDEDGKHVWVTAVTGWVPGKIPSDGAQIHNDLSGTGKDYTLLGAIAPQAFKGCTELKTLYFKDTDANNFNARFPFDFIIGDKAFADCPNLTEIKMMQYTTKGENHWEALSPEQVTLVGDSVFAGSPQANFTVDASKYQDFLSSQVWKKVNNRILIYGHTHVDMKVNGAQYSYMRNTAGDPLKNNAEGHDQLMETLRYWNADYQQFTASSLLTTADENIWYTKVVGVQASSLSDGTMRIYNDPGSYYNYKTIALESLGESKDVKAIEFWQTNGRSENSFSDFKMVIRNGALKGCTNLKELRMFYYVQDGDDHWEVLGPENVIPGDNIFGIPYEEEMEGLGDEEQEKKLESILPEDFKIIVSPDRYQDFINDPNWMVYQEYIEPAEFNPNNSDMNDFSLGGLTYGYMTSPGGIMQTSQTVSQDVSWWTFPRIAIEVAIDIASLGSAYSALAAVKKEAVELGVEAGAIKDVVINMGKTISKSSAKPAFSFKESVNMLLKTTAPNYGKEVFKKGAKNLSLQKLVSIGLVSKEGVWKSSEEIASLLGSMTFNPFYENVNKAALSVYANMCRQHISDVVVPNAFKSATTRMANRFLLGSTISRGITTAGYFSSKCWGGSGSYDGDALQKGMKANILSNIHQTALVGGGYVITSPQKNLCYHTYIKDVPASTTEAVIYAGTGKGQGRNNNARTMTMAKNAFRNHTSLKTVKFHETGIQSDEAVPMLFTIPDSAFVGCTNLERFDLRVDTKDNGQQALGPENFILGGDSIFVGLDPQKFHIVIDPNRKQDFLDNESWKPLAPYFVYEEAKPKTQYQEYGGNYAYAYENGTTQKVNKVSGHKIEHTVVTGADNEFLNDHQGALKLCNDIGVWNNYQLDAVTKKAFMGNENLRVVNFTDLKGTGAYGDSYTGLEVALMDSCFANCKNLANLDLLYLVTDEDNRIDPIKPEQVTIGKGVFDGTSAKIKMMPQQVAWFEADTTWNKYKDRFMPCIIKPGDEGIKDALKPMAYYDMAHTGYDPTTWDDYIDLARIAGAGFSWLDGKFREESDEIRSFADFQHFESVGLDYVGKEWFRGCRKLTNIVLPKTIKHIDEYAFASCTSLQEIDLPTALTEIGSCAFADCQDLKTIRVLGTTPATLSGTDQFNKNNGLKIYVPAASVDAYKTAWAEYKDYIVSDNDYKVVNEVTLTDAGTLAEKLGLYVEWSYSGGAAYDEPRYLHGNYAKYDSLVVHGPLNDLDLWTIRYLTGNNGYNRGGIATDGNLRYLNLYDTRIVKDDNKAHYLNKSWGIKWAWQDVQNANELPYNLFFNCTALESLVLPKTLTKMNARIFEGCSSLKRLAIPASLQDYDTMDYFKGLLDYPLDELVFVTDKPAVSDRSNPWGQEIAIAFTKQSQVSDYMNQPYLTRSASTIVAPFKEDVVMESLAEKGEFFPGLYLQKESIGNLFRGNDKIVHFDDFNLFANLKELEADAFYSCKNLKSIALPDSLQRIARTAFSGCTRLDTIYISTDSVPELAEHAFTDLPADFRILVPKTLCKVYREKWAEYADHINVDEQVNSADEWTVVTLDKPNTLAEKLGFEVKWDYRRFTVFSTKHNYIAGIRGDYSKIHKLKVNGPISGSDFAFMRYLAGFCPWANCRNTMGQLEAIDLYDAEIKASDDLSAPDMFKVITHMGPSSVGYDNELPIYAFLQAYNLKSLVLPKTCTRIKTRALQECEALETLVLGDDLVDFNWSSLDDCASLTRLYIMAKQKPKMDVDNWLARQLYNNYNPTFDAFYVRPSLYNEYLSDRAYTHDLQRTNLISKGVFDDDESFSAFARHAAATQDDLGTVNNVDGWFDKYPAAKNLTPLKYTSIDTLKAATMAPLTQLEQVALPKTLKSVEKNVFQKNTKLRYVDMLLSNDAGLMAGLRNGVHGYLGLNEQLTLAYMPAEYGDIGETNVVVNKGGVLKTKTYRMVDSLSYMVPYEFEAEKIENPRTLAASSIPYTFCVPYKMNVPQYARAYKLSSRDGNSLVFEEVKGELQTMQPYLLKVVGNKRLRKMSTTLNTDIQQTIPASGVMTYGRQVDAPGYSMRGTFDAISNAQAAEYGAYILQSDGDWHPVSTDNQKAEILPFRAFLLPSARNAAARLSMSLVDDTTGIDNIETIDEDGTRRYYDLNGRELPGKPAQGVYIYNGKKYMMK